jgi:adenylate cyclase
MRRAATALGIGAAASLLAWGLGLVPVARDLEHSTYDRRLVYTAHPHEARRDIALVAINESSVRALEPLFGRWPWPRVLHGGVIDFLTHAHARVIAYDVLFTEHDRRGASQVGDRSMTGTESDAELVAAVKRAGNVVLLAEGTFEGLLQEPAHEPAASLKLPGVLYRPGPGFWQRPRVLLPFPELADAALAVGHNILPVSGGTVREALPFVESAGVAVPSLGLAAALAAERVPAADVRLDRDVLRIRSHLMPIRSEPVPPGPGEPASPSKKVLLDFRGPASSSVAGTYPVYSFFDVLLSQERVATGGVPPIDPEVFRDKIVFVGTSAAGLSDVFLTPFKDSRTPGIQIHAALADDVLSNRFMRRAPAGLDLAVTIGVGLLVAGVAVFLPAWWATLGTLGIVALVVAGLTRAVGAGLWIALVPPVAAAALALFGGVAWQYFVEGREKRHVKKVFGRYVSRDVFDQLLSDPSLAKLGGQRREMTVLFSDIRGFTTASERSTPEEVVHHLNEYFTAMVAVLLAHRGTLDKFVGDMVMGLFGAPVADPEHADHAVACAVAMSAELDRLNAAWAAAGRPVLDIGIGINTGEMIAGNIGSDTIMSYTVIGDAVNLGARIESLNKDYGTRILISEATKARLTQPFTTRPLGQVVVKGKTQAVAIHEVVVPSEK